MRDGILHHPWSMPPPATLEAQVVRFADRIAYVNHDIDDAIRAGVLEPEELPARGRSPCSAPTHSARINTLVTDLVAHERGPARDPAVRRRCSRRSMSSATSCSPRSTCATARRRRAREGAIRLLRELFAYFLEHPDELPPEYHRAPGDLPTRVADYVAGMTDRYALRTYERLFLPQGWLL